MCDGYVHALDAFYWRGDDKTMFSPILEVTTIQDGGALAEKVYTKYILKRVKKSLEDQIEEYILGRAEI